MQNYFSNIYYSTVAPPCQYLSLKFSKKVIDILILYGINVVLIVIFYSPKLSNGNKPAECVVFLASVIILQT